MHKKVTHGFAGKNMSAHATPSSKNTDPITREPPVFAEDQGGMRANMPTAFVVVIVRGNAWGVCGAVHVHVERKLLLLIAVALCRYACRYQQIFLSRERRVRGCGACVCGSRSRPSLLFR